MPILSAILLVSSAYAVVKVIKKPKRAKRAKRAKKLKSLQANVLVPNSETEQKCEVSEEEQQYNRLLILSVGALSSNVVGSLLFPPLKLLSIPPLLYLTVKSIRDAYMDWAKDRKIGANANHAAFCFGMMALGSLGLLAVIWTVIAYAGKAMLKTRDTSRRNLINILGEIPQFVWITKNNLEIKTPFEDIQIGDELAVHAGSMIPVDGCIVKGTATIDQHMLTGEGQPVEKGTSALVYAGTIVLSGMIVVETQKTGEDSTAAQIGEILERTADYRSTTELRGVTIADRSVPPALAFSGLTWVLLGPAAAIAVISCSIGYHMTFTGPLSVLNFLQMAAKKGLLIKDGRALEMVPAVDTVVFDKTGTLTQEQPHIAYIHPCNDYEEQDVLRFAAAAEYKQTHPIARAILEAAASQELAVPMIDDAAYEIGYGIQVELAGQQVHVGSLMFMQRKGVTIPEELHAVQERCKQQGHSLVYISIDQSLGGVIELHATIRPEVEQVIQALKARDLNLFIISGDQESPTRQLADTLGIDDYFAEVLPEDKAKLISQLQSEGKSVCFIGDGINDAIALKTANVSVSLSGATTIAMDTAQVILRDGDLRALPELFEISDQLTKNMRVNLLASTVPGVISIAGVYFLSFGVLAANLLAWTGLGIGLTNAMSPGSGDDKTDRIHKP